MINTFILLFLTTLLSVGNLQQHEKIEILDIVAFREAVVNNDVQLVDVRTKKEYEKGHIDRAININYYHKDSFVSSFEKLNKDLPVYVYCHSGGRSKAAARRLVKMGFSKIYDLKGGFLVWE